MCESKSKPDGLVNNSDLSFDPGATGLLIASAVIIFVAEAVVMLLLYLLDLPGRFSTGLLDATLLSLVVVPFLYFTFLKPMRESFLKRNQSEESRSRLEEIDRMKSDFISIAAHELRTPVTTIMGYCEILQADLEVADREEYQRVILKESEKLQRLIDDLELVARLEVDNSIQLNQTNNDLNKTVHHVYTVYKHKFPELPIHLNLPKGPLPVYYDEVRIHQVLDNLLSNAVKYSKGNEDYIEVSVVEQPEHISICVKDNGVGMSKEEVQSVYDKFFRTGPKKTTVSGLGLGLAIVKNIIDSHEGAAITIDSHLDLGTSVTVSLSKASEALNMAECPAR